MLALVLSDKSEAGTVFNNLEMFCPGPRQVAGGTSPATLEITA